MALSDPSEGAEGVANGGSLSDSEGVLGDKLASTEGTESTPGDSIFSSTEMVSEMLSGSENENDLVPTLCTASSSSSLRSFTNVCLSTSTNVPGLLLLDVPEKGW